MPSAPPCAIVIFGASGDLVTRKLMPAIYDLAREGLLNERSRIIGFSRTKMDDAVFRRECRESVEQFARIKPFDEPTWKSIEPRIHYLSGEYGSREAFESLRALLDAPDYAGLTTRLLYLATPPSQFRPIIECLGQVFDHSRRDQGPVNRIIIEKPFGRDLESARALNKLVHQHFSEEQVFRIDHYLGKETVQNLMVMRFGNAIFEPIWNYKYIDHVQITVAESIGVGSRGGYYDTAGALRDMVQNHLFQLLALVAMEPPVGLDAASIRDEKVKVFRAIRPLRPASIDDLTVHGQYSAGEFDGEKTPGYLAEKGVVPDSRTETFAAVKLFIDNWRWSGMPFYLRTGKFLQQKLSEVAVRFRSPPLALFQKQCESPVYPNDLIIRVQPDEGISLRLNGKVPGGQMNIKPVALDFFYSTTFRKEPPEAYERLIHDAMIGDQTLFIRADEAEAAWGVIDPIETGWQRSRLGPEQYTPGSWGPKRAMDLIELDGRRWFHGSDAPEPIIACSL